MNICLVCEGSYPYVVGGVSSWVHLLISSMPEHNFSLATLYPTAEDKGNFKYDLPENVVDVHEFFLDTLYIQKGSIRGKYSATKEDLNEINKVLSGEDADWEILVNFFMKNKKKNPQDFLMSKTFYKSMINIYDKGYSNVALSDFFWSIRSMILPLVSLLGIDMPKADIYHTVSTGYAGLMATVGLKQHNGRMMLTEHGIYTREREEEIIAADWVPTHFKDMWIKYFKNLSMCAYKYSEIVISLFEDASKIQRELGCDLKKQLIIENGINTNMFMELENKKLGQDGYVIGAVVRIVPIKDILTLLQAFRRIKDELEDSTLYIIGPYDESKEYYEECIAITRLLDLSDSVIFTGRVNVLEYMPKMDICLLTSISEGQPLSILEALAAGIPFVATNVGSCSEIIYGDSTDELGDAGIVVPVMNYEEIARAVIKILKNPQLHASMSKVGKERLTNKYSKVDLIKKYRELYSSLAGEV